MPSVPNANRTPAASISCQRQLRQPQRGDGRHRDVERAHRLQQVAAAALVDLGDREAVRDVDLAGEAERLGAGDDELELERAELGRVVQVDVDAGAVLRGEGEDRVELADRVAVDARRVDAAEVLDAAARGLAHHVEHAGPAQHAVLRERDDLDGECAVVGCRGLAHRVDRAESDVGVDVHVGADRRGAVADELVEDAPGDVGARVAELAAPLALVADAALGAALAAVRLPREPDPRHVDVGVRVHETGEGEQAPSVDLARADGVIGGRDDRVDEAGVGDADVARRAAPRPDVAESRAGLRGSGHQSILAARAALGIPSLHVPKLIARRAAGRSTSGHAERVDPLRGVDRSDPKRRSAA